MSVAMALAGLGALPAAIPSPSQGVWHLGPIPVRAYALAILVGIVAALWLTTRRWEARGGTADSAADIAFWAVPFGIIGGRLYHVISSPAPYFGPDGNPIRALYIWQGGLGIWGAIALGAVGAWIGTRRSGVRFAPFADALAPGLLVAQGIGRLGNWFNQELFGLPTTLPWGLRIDDAHLPAGLDSGTLFQPTFLYELLWDLGGAALVIYLDRRWRLGHGRVFWLYVVVYTTGRLWIELLRIDPAEHVLGLRLNVWTSIVVGLGALVAFLVIGRRGAGRDPDVRLASVAAAQDEAAQDEAAQDEDSVEVAPTEPGIERSGGGSP